MTRATCVRLALVACGVLVTGAMVLPRRGAGDAPTMSPNVALRAIMLAKAATPECCTAAQQRAIVHRYLPRIRVQDTTPDDRYAIAEAYFMALDPDHATTLYRTVATGTDAHARIANLRLMWMRMAAYQKFDSIEPRILAFRANFPPTEDDLHGDALAVFGLADHYRDQKDHAAAVRLVEDELRTLPTDAPFAGLTLPVDLLASFDRLGQRDSALAILGRTRDALAARLARESRLSRPTTDALRRLPPRAGAIYRIEDGLLADLPPRDMFRIRLTEMVDSLSIVLRNPPPVRTAAP
jgi:hypothetical protein